MAYLRCPYCDEAPREHDYATHLSLHRLAVARENALLQRLRDLEDQVRTLRRALMGHE